MKKSRPPRLDCRRPLPAGFAAIARTMTKRGLARHFCTSAAVIRRWCTEAGAEVAIQAAPPHRPCPPDFAEMAGTMTRRQLTKLYRTNTSIIARWLAETGTAPLRGVRYDARPVPEDFTTLAPTMYGTHLAAHYGGSYEMVMRWARLTGVPPKKMPPGRPRWERLAAARAARPPKPRTSRPAAFRTPKQAHSFDTLRRDTTLEGRAADHLRHYAPVYRCTETGRADQTGAWWRYGNAVVSAEELIERAIRKGWSPDAWRRIAA